MDPHADATAAASASGPTPSRLSITLQTPRSSIHVRTLSGDAARPPLSPSSQKGSRNVSPKSLSPRSSHSDEESKPAQPPAAPPAPGPTMPSAMVAPVPVVTAVGSARPPKSVAAGASISTAPSAPSSRRGSINTSRRATLSSGDLAATLSRLSSTPSIAKPVSLSATVPADTSRPSSSRRQTMQPNRSAASLSRPPSGMRDAATVAAPVADASSQRQPLPNCGTIDPKATTEMWEALRMSHPKWSEFTSNELVWGLNPFASVVHLALGETIVVQGDYPSFFAVILRGSARCEHDLDELSLGPSSAMMATYSTGDVVGSEHIWTAESHAMVHAATQNGTKAEQLRGTPEFDANQLPVCIQPHLPSAPADRSAALSALLKSSLHGLDLNALCPPPSWSPTPVSPRLIASAAPGSPSCSLALHPCRPFTVSASAVGGATVAVFSYADFRSLLPLAHPSASSKLSILLAADSACKMGQLVAAGQGGVERLWSGWIKSPSLPSSGLSTKSASSPISQLAIPGSPPPPIGRQTSTADRSNSKKRATASSPAKDGPGSPVPPSKRVASPVITSPVPSVRSPEGLARVSSVAHQSVVTRSTPPLGCCNMPINTESIWSRFPARSLHLEQLLVYVRAPNCRAFFGGAESGGGLHPRRNSSGAIAVPAMTDGSTAGTTTSSTPPSSASSTKPMSVDVLKRKLAQLTAQLSTLQSSLNESLTSEKYWRSAHAAERARFLEEKNRADALKKDLYQVNETHAHCDTALKGFKELEKAMCAPWLKSLDDEAREVEREKLEQKSVNSRLTTIGNIDLDIRHLRDETETTPGEGTDATGGDDSNAPSSPKPSASSSIFSSTTPASLTPAQLSSERARFLPRLLYLRTKVAGLREARKELAQVKQAVGKFEAMAQKELQSRQEVEDEYARMTTQHQVMGRALDFQGKLNVGLRNDIASYQAILKSLLLHLHVKQYMIRRRGLKVLQKLRTTRIETDLKGLADVDGREEDGRERMGTTNELSTLMPNLESVGRDGKLSPQKNQTGSSASQFKPLPGSYLAHSLEAVERARVHEMFASPPKPTTAANQNANNSPNTRRGSMIVKPPPPPSALTKLSLATRMNLFVGGIKENGSDGPSPSKKKSAASTTSADISSLAFSELEQIVPRLLRTFVEMESGISVEEQVKIMKEMKQERQQRAKEEPHSLKRRVSIDGTSPTGAANDDSPLMKPSLAVPSPHFGAISPSGGRFSMTTPRGSDASGLALEAFTDSLPASALRLNHSASNLPTSVIQNGSRAPSRMGAATTPHGSRSSIQRAVSRLDSLPTTDTFLLSHSGIVDDTLNGSKRAFVGQTPSLYFLLTQLKDESLLLHQNFIQLRSQLLLWRRITQAFAQRNLQLTESMHLKEEERRVGKAAQEEVQTAKEEWQKKAEAMERKYQRLKARLGKEEQAWAVRRAELDAQEAAETEKLVRHRDEIDRQVKSLALQLGTLSMERAALIESAPTIDRTALERVVDVLNPYATEGMKQIVLGRHGKEIGEWTAQGQRGGISRSPSQRSPYTARTSSQSSLHRSPSYLSPQHPHTARQSQSSLHPPPTRSISSGSTSSVTKLPTPTRTIATASSGSRFGMSLHSTELERTQQRAIRSSQSLRKIAAQQEKARTMGFGNSTTNSIQQLHFPSPPTARAIHTMTSSPSKSQLQLMQEAQQQQSQPQDEYESEDDMANDEFDISPLPPPNMEEEKNYEDDEATNLPPPSTSAIKPSTSGKKEPLPEPIRAVASKKQDDEVKVARQLFTAPAPAEDNKSKQQASPPPAVPSVVQPEQPTPAAVASPSAARLLSTPSPAEYSCPSTRVGSAQPSPSSANRTLSPNVANDRTFLLPSVSPSYSRPSTRASLHGSSPNQIARAMTPSEKAFRDWVGETADAE